MESAEKLEKNKGKAPQQPLEEDEDEDEDEDEEAGASIYLGHCFAF